MKCQVCHESDLITVIDLGMLPLVNSLPLQSNTGPDNCHEISIVQCAKCTLVQLASFPSMPEIFPDDYPYLSGLTPPLLANFAEQAKLVSEFMSTKNSKLVFRVLDIGSNDGSLLSYYQELGHRAIGVEPTSAAHIANSNGIETIKDYFDVHSARAAMAITGELDVVTATNVFAHIPEPLKIVENISEILSSEGIFVSENHYFVDLINSLQIDTIYHEHLRYYTLTSVSNLLALRGFEVFRVQKIGSHGGSIRVWSARKGAYPIEDSVNKMKQTEFNQGFVDGSYIKKLQEDVSQWRIKIRALISEVRTSGGIIAGIGAPSRAVTLLTCVGLNREDIACIGEKTGSKKIGKRIPTTKIPIVDESEALSMKPSHLILLSWHIKDSLIPILRKKGFSGKYIIPLPLPKIIN